ncbi:MAG: Crp/Fnr family transcriptional regulator [Bacteroidaceae bacterium]|nr:Crp/Fnr family transcriptional regulator [Bacteroidaceae bacterium]MBQ8938378.1 Crp/Fnr family transcriptional regulator [Bacteroidaceae bacterium]MBQ9191340.1 Crp/Fnr family transcriptional regulator [Bacteroidaceae bacterium]MBR0244585.1 Crp/Fnr family transcriptional regulator [Bacteroidaceae bacterium]MBR1665734.1 Crp/Fnr family transcriptional regulator [Bacteroidaceae bacterium]
MARKALNIVNVLPKLAAITDLLTEQEKETLLQQSNIQLYRKNEVIYSEGEVPHYLFCLISGKVKIYKEGVGGRAQIVRVVKPVEYFGYRAAFAGEDYVTSAAAFEPTTIVRCPVKTVAALLQQNARLGWFFIQRLSANLGQADERTVSLTQKHIRGRLAESLLFLKQNYGVEEDGSTLSIYLSREDLANLSNMTTSNAIRTLSMFAAERIVAIDGRKIKIMDEVKLQKISRIG